MSRRVLDLFSGLGGFSSAFEDADDWQVTTVDVDERFDADIQADVLNLRPSDLPGADVVVASPPCTQFSIAASRYERFDGGEPQTEDARDAVVLVYHTLGLIKSLSPDYWIMENPQGYLRQVIGEPDGRITFCEYGTPYMKPTDLWGDFPPTLELRACSYGDDCHQSNRDRENGGDGNCKWADELGDIIRDSAERAKIPREFSESVLQAVEEAYAEPTTRQMEIGEVRV